MTALRHHLKAFVWVALVAICGVAFGPSMSRAPASAGPRAPDLREHRTAMEAHAQIGHTGHMPHMADMATSAQARPGEQRRGGPDHSSCLLDCCALCAVAASPFAAVAAFVLPGPTIQSRAPAAADLARARPDRRALWSRAAPRGPATTS